MENCWLNKVDKKYPAISLAVKIILFSTTALLTIYLFHFFWKFSTQTFTLKPQPQLFSFNFANCPFQNEQKLSLA
jgi:hypothetical protein